MVSSRQSEAPRDLAKCPGKVQASHQLPQHAEAGKLEQELLLAGILEADVGLGILARTLDAEHLTDAEALVFDELAWGELGYTGGTSRGIGRDEATR